LVLVSLSGFVTSWFWMVVIPLMIYPWENRLTQHRLLSCETFCNCDYIANYPGMHRPSVSLVLTCHRCSSCAVPPHLDWSEGNLDHIFQNQAPYWDKIHSEFHHFNGQVASYLVHPNYNRQITRGFMFCSPRICTYSVQWLLCIKFKPGMVLDIAMRN